MKIADEVSGRKSYWIVVLLVAVLGTAADLFSKYLIFRCLSNKTVDIIPGALGLTKTLNSGIIWGLFSGENTIFLVLTFLTIPLILLLFREIGRQEDKPWLGKSWLMAVAFGLILSGAIGNLYDRVMLRAVRDFIDFYLIKWPIFNIADIYITAGAILIIILMFKRSQSESEQKNKPKCPESACDCCKQDNNA
ncbi:MAG: signal peptidase II [Candidatus Brocadiia bacterium]